MKIAAGKSGVVVFNVTTAGQAVIARSSKYTKFRMSLLTEVTGTVRNVQPTYIP